MTTDRELLELAAKAAGIPVPADTPWNGIEPAGRGVYRLDSGGSTEFRWNPLADDGDALRLMATMAFNVYYVRPWVYVQDLEYSSGVNIVEQHTDDIESKIAATRRAVVRAAAEIGRAMLS